MSSDVFEKIIEGSWINPDSNAPIGSIIKHVYIGNLKAKINYLLEQACFDKKHVTIVCDRNSYKVLGSYIHEVTKNDLIILPSDVRPDTKVINKLSSDIKASSALIAVGSGTINDICKYASFLNKIPYLVFATAPSMNGYASISASVIENGLRTSKRAHYPVAIFMDLEVMTNSPIRLIRAGIGDMLCRSTAQVDWLFSHMVLATPYYSAPFAMLSFYENKMLSFLENWKKTEFDSSFVENLAKMLVISGIGMTISGGSYPASQGEHMIAHTMEMVYGDKMSNFYHGEQIAVTTLAMAKIQEFFLSTSWEELLDHKIDKSESEIEDFFGSKLAKNCLYLYKKKKIFLEKAVQKIITREQEIKTCLKPVFIQAKKLEVILINAGLEPNFSFLGLDKQQYNQSVRFSKYSRDRFTFLDVINEEVIKLL